MGADEVAVTHAIRVAFKLRYWEVRGRDHELAGKDGSSPWLRERTLDDAGQLLSADFQ